MARSKDTAPSQAHRILIVDDSRNGLLVRKGVLEQNGYQVVAFAAADDAIAAFDSESYDLVITDYRMPKMKGTDVIRHIRASGKTTPVILISSVVDTLGLNEANTGADAVVSKTAAEINHLLRAVARLLKPQPKRGKPSVTSVDGAPPRKPAAKQGATQPAAKRVSGRRNPPL